MDEKRIGRRWIVGDEDLAATIVSKRFLRAAERSELTTFRLLDLSIYGASLAIAAPHTIRSGDELDIERNGKHCVAAVRNVQALGQDLLRVGVEFDAAAMEVFDDLRTAARLEA